MDLTNASAIVTGGAGAVVAWPADLRAAGGWGGDHHDGVPIWVFSRHEPAST